MKKSFQQFQEKILKKNPVKFLIQLLEKSQNEFLVESGRNLSRNSGKIPTMDSRGKNAEGILEIILGEISEGVPGEITEVPSEIF